jgi:undecaprenyl-diphosphatase
MVLIPIMGASLLEIKDFVEAPDQVSSISGMALLLGFIAAFVAGLLACKWMISIVKKGKLIYFAIYCFIVGVIAIITALS